MSVGTIDCSAEFVTNGTVNSFPFYFKFLDGKDLVVIYISPEGVSSKLLMGMHYTLIGAGNNDGASIQTREILAGPGQLIVFRDRQVYQQAMSGKRGASLSKANAGVFDRLILLVRKAYALFSQVLTRPFGRDCFDAQNRRIASVKDPVDPQDAATKHFVDRLIAERGVSAEDLTDTADNIIYVGPNDEVAKVQHLSGSQGSLLLGHNAETVADVLKRVGENNCFALGGVVQNTRDYSLNGDNVLPELAVFSKVNFDASGYHASGSLGNMTTTASPAGSDFSLYMVTVVLQTEVAGCLNIKFDGAPIMSDQPSGYLFSTAPIKTAGVENNRDIDPNTYSFIYATSGTAFTTVSIESDTSWGGQVYSLSLVPVAETMFALAGAGTENGPKNPIGFKACAYGRNDIAFGDRYTLASLKYDGLPQTPAHNLAIGAKALATNQFGDQNTAIGTYALEFNETSNNIALGYSAAKLNTKGRELTAIGYKSLTNNTTGSANTATGFWSLGLNTTGTDNCAFGWYSLRNLLLGNFNTAHGSNAGMMALSGSGNTYVGAYAGYGNGAAYATYANTTAVGRESLAAGDNAIAIGFQARSGSLSLSSPFSVAIGSSSSAAGATPCVAVGASSAASGDRTVAIGESAVASGPKSVAIGAHSAASAQYVTSVGTQAGAGSTGINNTFLGALAGFSPNAFNGCTLLGSSTAATGDNQVQLGAFGTVPYAFAALQIRADERDATDVKPLKKSYEFIRAHKGMAIQYRYDLRAQYTSGKPDGSKAGKSLHAGFPAQKVSALAKKIGITFTGVSHHADTGGLDVWSMGYEQYVPHLVEAQAIAIEMLEAQALEIERLWARIKVLEGQKE